MPCATIPDMDRQRVIEALRAHEPELRVAGIVHLSVFGSVARNEASETSDVDLMAEFDTTRRLTLLDMVGLENRLSDILNINVDLTPAKTMKARVRERAEREAIIAF
jgi:uncharacterized protein